ncbi:MAG: hypothetical protein R6U87_04775 [Thiohalospira sp.]
MFFRKELTLKTLSRYALPVLLSLPWFFQMIFPGAWVANEYYDYPALYGFCIIIAGLWLRTWDTVSAPIHRAAYFRIGLLTSLTTLVVLSNAWDYRAFFRSSYYPWPLVTSADPFLSAREVERMNQDRLPVLADTAFTLYYTEARVPEEGRFILWHSEESRMIEAIKKRDYHYVVFTYPPTVSIMNAIHSSGYEQIAPAAWRQLANW